MAPQRSALGVCPTQGPEESLVCLTGSCPSPVPCRGTEAGFCLCRCLLEAVPAPLVYQRSLQLKEITSLQRQEDSCLQCWGLNPGRHVLTIFPAPDISDWLLN